MAVIARDRPRDQDHHLDTSALYAYLDDDLHEAAVTALLAAAQRQLSLVDWVSFTVMRRRVIDEAFAFDDDDFTDQGFTLVP